VDEKETGDDFETCCIIFASGNFLEDGERERERAITYKCVCVCVCVRERERERYMCVCMSKLH